MAKTTPTKKGQFVTIWKRHSDKGHIIPFDINDNIDFIVIRGCMQKGDMNNLSAVADME